MALVTVNLPKCDVCGEVTLPSTDNVCNGISARDDIRAYDAARRAQGLSPYRCGKCKSPGWDREYTGDRRRKDPHAAPTAQEAKDKTFRPQSSQDRPIGAGLNDLYGTLADVYKELGGGEAYLKAERSWGPDVWQRYEEQHERAREESRR